MVYLSSPTHHHLGHSLTQTQLSRDAFPFSTCESAEGHRYPTWTSSLSLWKPSPSQERKRGGVQGVQGLEQMGKEEPDSTTCLKARRGLRSPTCSRSFQQGRDY